MRHVRLLERGDLLGRRARASSAATASSRCCGLRRADDRRGHGRLARAARPARPARAARRARRRPRRRASTTSRSASSVARRASCRTRRSRRARSPSSQARVSRPRASGLHGITPMPSVARRAAASRAPPRGRAGCSGSASTTKRVQPCRSATYSALRELPGVHRRRADVARLAGLHDVVQRLERLLDRRRRGPSGGSGRGRRSRCRAGAGWRRSRSGSPCATGPRRSGPAASRPCTLVAITTSSRRAKSRSARPTISSLVPSE